MGSAALRRRFIDAGVRRIVLALCTLATSLASAQVVPPSPASASSDVWNYRVREGDNLYDIARTYLRQGYGWRSLQRLNRVADPLRLPPDRQLVVPIDWLRTEASVASVVYLRGDVTRTTDGGPAQPLRMGDTVQAGDTVQCATEAEATLRLDDGSRVLLSGGSRMRVAQLLKLGPSDAVSADFELEQGEADSRVTPKPTTSPRFRVRTPALTLGVRGTDFRARVEPAGGATRAEVATGRVGAGITPAASAPDASSHAAAPREPAATTVAAGQGLRRDAGDPGPLRTVPLLPAPDLSRLPAKVERLPIDLRWNGDAPGGYRAQLYDDAALEHRVVDDRPSGPRLRWSDVPDGAYRLRVRAIDAAGLEGRDTVVALEVNARPEPPFSRAPTGGQRVYGNQARLAWTGSESAARYRLQLAPDDGSTVLASPTLDRADLEATELGVPLAPGRWRWRLATIARDGEQGPWGDLQRFELLPEPVGPASLDTQADESGRLAVRWAAREPGDRYDVQLIGADHGSPRPTVAGFAKPRFEKRLDQPVLELDGLAPGHYLLRVRTVTADGHAGPWGSALQVEVPKRHELWRFLPVIGVLLFLL